MIGVVIVPEARPKEPTDMWRDGPICSCAIAMFVRSTSATAKPSERRGCDKQKGKPSIFQCATAHCSYISAGCGSCVLREGAVWSEEEMVASVRNGRGDWGVSEGVCGRFSGEGVCGERVCGERVEREREVRLDGGGGGGGGGGGCGWCSGRGGFGACGGARRRVQRRGGCGRVRQRQVDNAAGGSAARRGAGPHHDAAGELAK